MNTASQKVTRALDAGGSLAVDVDAAVEAAGIRCVVGAREGSAGRKGKTLGLQKSAAVVIGLTRRAATAFQIFCTLVN